MFDDHPKGTTVFYCPQTILNKVYDIIGDKPLSSDDTESLKAISGLSLIYFDPSIFIVNYGRQGFWESVSHLYARGPKFVAYYSNPSSKYFPYIVLACFALLAALAISIYAPSLLVGVAMISLISWFSLG